MLKNLGILTLILIVIGLFIVGPLITIWSLNTLFPALAIPYAWDTWLAVIGLGLFFNARVSSASKK